MLRKIPALTSALILAAVLLGAQPANATLRSDWTTVTVGWSHTCAIRGSGVLFCWGSNDGGQLGDGTKTKSLVPKRITRHSDWTSVSAGHLHTCAIRGAGILYCWGTNRGGQLGDGTTTKSLIPKKITTYTDWKSVNASWLNTCGIRGSGELFCWGWNLDGNLDDHLDDTYQYTPLRIGAAADWTSVSNAGKHACGMRGAGLVYCWWEYPPQQYRPESGWTTVSDGDPDTCAIRGGLLYCDSGIVDEEWEQMTARTGWTSVVAAADVDHEGHSCAIRDGGKLYCWAVNWNDFGQVGDGTTESRSQPVRIGSRTDWRTVAVGFGNTCGIRAEGRLFCWGSGWSGEVGDGTTVDRHTPRRI